MWKLCPTTVCACFHIINADITAWHNFHIIYKSITLSLELTSNSFHQTVNCYSVNSNFITFHRYQLITATTVINLLFDKSLPPNCIHHPVDWLPGFSVQCFTFYSSIVVCQTKHILLFVRFWPHNEYSHTVSGLYHILICLLTHLPAYLSNT